MERLDSLALSRRRLCQMLPALPISLLGTSGRAGDVATPSPEEGRGEPSIDSESEFTDSQVIGNQVARFVEWPSFEFINHHHENADLYRDVLAKRTIVLNFFYTRCDGNCPTTFGRMIQLARLQKERGRATRFVSITLDPDNDTPAVLNKYSEDLNASKVDWHFLSGTLDVTNSVRRFLSFYDLNEPVGQVLRRHASMVLIGDDNTHRWITLPAVCSLRQWRSSLARCSATST